MTDILAASPIQLSQSGLPGESATAVARRVGTFLGAEVTPGMSDEQVLDAPLAVINELLAAANYVVVDPVRTVSTSDITLSGAQTINGVPVIAGDRVLVARQSTGAANGIYVVAAGAWSRATDFNDSAEVVTGAYVVIEDGRYRGAWVLTTTGTIVVGTTAQAWKIFRLDGARKVNVLDFGAGAGGDDTPAFESANAAGSLMEVPPLPGGAAYNLDAWAPLVGTYVQAHGARFRAGASGECFFLDHADGATLDSPTLVGDVVRPTGLTTSTQILDWLEANLTSAGDPDRIAIRIHVCNDVRIINPWFENWQGRCFYFTGGQSAIPSPLRGDTNQIINPRFRWCWRMFETVAGDTSAEFTRVFMLDAAAIADRSIILVGNMQFETGGITDSIDGIHIDGLDGLGAPATNHGHGQFTGFELAHIRRYAFRARNQLFGYKFTNNTVYGEGVGVDYPSGQSNVRINDCIGVEICGNTIDAPFQVDGPTARNFFCDNYLPNPDKVGPYYENPLIPSQMTITGNRTPNGPWAYNQRSNVNVEASRSGTAQTLTSGTETDLLFNSVTKDIHDDYSAPDYDPATGEWTCRIPGYYTFDVEALFDGTAASKGVVRLSQKPSAGSYGDIGFAPIGPSGHNFESFASRAWTKFCGTGDKVKLRAYCDGTAPVLKISSALKIYMAAIV